ncbi:MAG TPA: hypothetical protein P5528_05645 [Steroidobacteraceae bacterium]|nr:hypothetical protein [Steroidobacteraceae bacterium]HRX88912.1 hypothetical protein [Steroidobacteraceae bacterium]
MKALASLAAGLLVLAGSPAKAQTTPADTPRSTAPSPPADDLEPAVDTSAPVAAPDAASRRAAAQTPRADDSTTTTDRAGASERRGRVIDRVELEATQITGNRELPKVLYIVPWKRPDLGDLGGRPINSLLDEVLAPVDRDVFKRENRYFDAVKPDTSPAAPDTATETSVQPEK